MIVFMNPTATEDQLTLVDDALATSNQFIESSEYCDEICSLEEADRIFAGEPGVRELLTEDTILTQFKAVPTEGTDVDLLRQVSDQFAELPGVVQSAARPLK